MKIARRRILWLTIAALLLLPVGFTAYDGAYRLASTWLADRAQPSASDLEVLDERTDGLHFTIVDDQGNIVLQTGHMVTVGDEYVDEGNRHWRVVSAHGDQCQAVQIGMFSLEIDDPDWASAWLPTLSTPWYLPAQAPRSAQVGVYHTHGDESYVQGDGTSSKPQGGIMDVGRSLVQSMQQQGIAVRHELERHAPHDSGAYRRSRRTATALLRQGSGTLLDIHRDAAPRAAYETEINGEPASKVMLVVGRANPQMQTTLNFARSFKRTLDEEHPGMVRGIYFGRGSYNQDTSPRAVLVEVGSHRTPKEHALRTAAVLGQSMPAILGVAGTPAAGAEQASRSNLGWIVLVVLLGGAAYLVVASGGFEPALEKAKGFVRREFASALVPPRRRGQMPPGGGRGRPEGARRSASGVRREEQDDEPEDRQPEDEG